MSQSTYAVATSLATEMGVTYNDVISFARVVAAELEKDKVDAKHLEGQTGVELVEAYLAPAIRTQERAYLIYQTNPEARSAFMAKVYADLAATQALQALYNRL